MKTTFGFKKREDLSTADKSVYDSAVKQLAFFPNMYAVIANSKTALSRYVKAEFTPSSLTTNENEIISLVVSEVNNCQYCLSFHTSYLLKLGFSDVQIIEIRKGSASFDAKLNALIKLTKSVVEKRGHVDTQLVDDLIAAGYTIETVIDTIIMINLRGVTNYVYAALGGFEIDFPLAPII